MASAADRPSSPSQGGSRAFRLGSHPLAWVGVLAIALAGCAVVLVVGNGGHTRAGAARHVPQGVDRTSNPLFKPTSTARAGGLPSWLPRPKVRTDRILLASLAHPQLGIEGDTIHAALPDGGASVTAVGPEVPEEGHFPVPASTPATFVVTLTDVTGRVPVGAAAFTLLDEHGVIHHPRVTTMAGVPVSRTLSPGAPLSVELHAILPTGSGSLIWAPVGGRRLASWDYDVEID